jgi:hypothetical protein
VFDVLSAPIAPRLLSLQCLTDSTYSVGSSLIQLNVSVPNRTFNDSRQVLDRIICKPPIDRCLSVGHCQQKGLSRARVSITLKCLRIGLYEKEKSKKMSVNLLAAFKCKLIASQSNDLIARREEASDRPNRFSPKALTDATRKWSSNHIRSQSMHIEWCLG